MKRPTMLVKAMLQDAALDLDLSVERDEQRIVRRCKHEGFSFLAITLPSLSDALERGLESGTFTCPTNFSRHGSLPRFMGGFFKRVFTIDGRLRQEACPNTVFWIRQICRFFKKPKIACSKKRNDLAVQSFLDVEGELRRATPLIERQDNVLDSIAGILWAQVFPELDYIDLVCSHGPGFTADRRRANARHRLQRWYQRSEHSYPSDLHAYPNYGYAAEAAREQGDASDNGLEYTRLRDELPVRVVFVPKTLTTPRVIALEPSNVQYMQQSLKDYVYKVLEWHPLTKHSIRFTRQDVNQRLAYCSSIDKRLATLDLKDASDRVHLHLVQRIFKTSGILEYLEDARSLHATLPNEKSIVLSKYASMGSALCFPVEAMVFYTLILSAMHQLDGRRPSSRSIRDYSRKIAIYGDDIIVPIEYTDVVVNYLESYALKVNVSKSFKEGNFRESCGADFFKGVSVKPVYARRELHDDLRHWGAEEILSWNATADQLYILGLWKSCQVIRSLLSRVVRRSIPKTRSFGPGLAHFSFLFTTGLRWNADLQCWKQKRLQFQPSKRKDEIDGDELACLNKWGLSVHSRTYSPIYGGSDTTRYRSGDVRLVEPGRDLSPDSLLFHFRTGSGKDESDNLSKTSMLNRNRTGPEHEHSSGSSGESSLSRVHTLSGNEDGETHLLSPVVRTSETVCLSLESPGGTARAGNDGWTDFCLTTVVPDPLAYLDDSASELDFLTSTKRGSFKSKCRWVNLAG